MFNIFIGLSMSSQDQHNWNNHFWTSITQDMHPISNIRKLYTTFVFTIFTENIICSMMLSSQQKMHMQPFQNVTICCFTCFDKKEHAHMSHSRTSATTNILINTLLNTNHSKHHQIQLQALSTIMLLLILSPNEHIYDFSDISEQLVWG